MTDMYRDCPFCGRSPIYSQTLSGVVEITCACGASAPPEVWDKRVGDSAVERLEEKNRALKSAVELLQVECDGLNFKVYHSQRRSEQLEQEIQRLLIRVEFLKWAGGL